MQSLEEIGVAAKELVKALTRELGSCVRGGAGREGDVGELTTFPLVAAAEHWASVVGGVRAISNSECAGTWRRVRQYRQNAGAELQEPLFLAS